MAPWRSGSNCADRPSGTAALQKGLEMLRCSIYLSGHRVNARNAIPKEQMQMTATPDFTKTFNDMMSAFPTDFSAMTDMFKNTAQLGERLSRVALSAAEESADVSTRWTKETIAKLGEVTKAHEEPADYSKAASDFASASAEMAAEHMAAFAEIAKRVQMETMELMMASGKEFSEEATAAMKKATDDMTAAAKGAAN
jgi:methyl-accepting chemotaxis protein